MSRHIPASGRMAIPVFAAALAMLIATPALAQSVGAQAGGRVEILKPGGTGIAYDALTETLSGMFLAGGEGEPVSLLVAGKRGKGSKGLIPQQVLVLSTGSYQLDLPADAPPDGQPTQQPAGDLLFLAQFN